MTSKITQITQITQYPTCNDCGQKMTEINGNGWYTCPDCGQKIRDNKDGTWTWRDELFKPNKTQSLREETKAQ